MMKKQYQRIMDIDRRYPREIARKIGKVSEEFGELVAAVYILHGWKRNKNNLSEAQVYDNILEEGVDTIQNVLCVIGHFGFTYEDIMAELDRKNKEFDNAAKKLNDD